MDWIMAGLIGGLVGTSELVARYRDAPVRAVLQPSAIFYIVLNAAASVFALGLARVFNWNFGVQGSNTGEQLVWTQVLVCGFGAMALFRSSLFTVRVGDQSVGIGPSSFLQIVLGAADRAVDRTRAAERADTVAQIMQGVSFEKQAWDLSVFALALMQNAPEEFQQGLRTQIEGLTARSDIGDYSKALSLGLLIMNMMGEGVLRASVKTLMNPKDAGPVK